jgi:hypothetical protein
LQEEINRQKQKAAEKE